MYQPRARTAGPGAASTLLSRTRRLSVSQPWHRNPVNEGKLCPKGNYAWEFINSPDRLTKPLIKKDGKFEEARWDEAYKLIVSKFKSYKGEEMACLSSARVSNEENYLMQKFARAVLKTPNIDHCARLCHASTVVGLAGAFGSGAMTNSIGDIGESKCIFVLGSNTLEQHPLIGRQIILAKQRGAKVICADPRFTPTAKLADLYMPFDSGTDVALLNGIMQHILKNGWENKEFIAKRTKDFDKLKEVVMKDTYSLENVSKITEIPAKDIATAAEWIAKAESSNVLYSMGITQHTTGVDNVKSVANLQMITGHLGKRGGGVCALRGQNNVQGACDMGALANVYSGYQSVIVPEMRKKMIDAWGCDIAEGKVGLTVTKLINVLADEPGKVKCVYIMGENPMISDPDLHHVEKGLKNVEFMVVQDIFMTETAQLAHVVLPGACFAEKDGTQTRPNAVSRNGERRRTRRDRQRQTGRSSVSSERRWDTRNSSRSRAQKRSSPKFEGHPVLWWHGLYTPRKARSTPLALPDQGAPGNTHPPQGEDLPTRTGWASLPPSSSNTRPKSRTRTTRSS